MCFITAVEHPQTGKLIVDRKVIVKMYLKGWFWLDFIACFPFQLIDLEAISSAGSNSKILRLARLPRLYRLVRLLRMVKIVRLLRASRSITGLIELLQVNPAMSRLSKILFGVLYLVHVFSCIWFFVANFDKKEGCWADGKDLWDKSAMHQYMVSVYWSL